jgi:hypothetical protein
VPSVALAVAPNVKGACAAVGVAEEPKLNVGLRGALGAAADTSTDEAPKANAGLVALAAGTVGAPNVNADLRSG